MSDSHTLKLTYPPSISISSFFQAKKTIHFTYFFTIIFISCTILILSFKNQTFSYKKTTHFSLLLSNLFPNATERNFQTFANVSAEEFKWEVIDQYDDDKSMLHCDIYDGKWVQDESYPLYEHGSCPIIDHGFNCFLNGRPDVAYEKLRWQPNHCNIPRLNATHMLELLRGKRVVFVGDSLNRNMWESLVCILRNSVQNKSMVFEASGRHEYRTQGSYTFIFKDYNISVEYFRSPFLVQKWELPGKNGSTRERLRLDLVETSFDGYKDADVLVFNSGHWWTRGRTFGGKDYYQEGSHVYRKLHVMEAYRRALKTWAKWVDSNIDSEKSLVFFRGYSSSHFRGGMWNSGGKCDKETEPFKNETYLLSYPSKMQILEDIMKSTKTPVIYLNVSRLTDYRKDAHPAVYTAQYVSDEERLSPLRYQDCSHWCLPGVPDIWNELLYAQMLIRHYQKQQKEH